MNITFVGWQDLVIIVTVESRDVKVAGRVNYQLKSFNFSLHVGALLLHHLFLALEIFMSLTFKLFDSFFSHAFELDNFLVELLTL